MNIGYLKNWHFSRWLVLVAGLFFAWQAVHFRDAVPALVGVFLLYQSITGKGCLVYGSCPNTGLQKEADPELRAAEKNIEYTTIEK